MLDSRWMKESPVQQTSFYYSMERDLFGVSVAKTLPFNIYEI